MLKNRGFWIKKGARRGNALLMMLPFLMFMVVFGYALIRRSTSEHTLSYVVHRKNVASYAAEGVLAIADNFVRKELECSLKERIINKNLHSYNLYKESSIVKKQVDDLLSYRPGLTLEKLVLDYVDIGKFKGGYSSDPNDRKESYGTLLYVAEVKFIDIRVRLKITRDIKVVNVTPPGNDYTFYLMEGGTSPQEINRGQVIVCINKDKGSKQKGKIRMEGNYTLVVGDKDYYSMPVLKAKSLLPSPWGASKLNNPKISVGQPLTDPGYGYVGIQKIENTETNKLKRHGKIRLFGSYYLTKTWATTPTRIEGNVKKTYLKVPYKFTFMAPAVPPDVPATYYYTLDYDSAEKIVKDYKSIGGFEGPMSPISHLTKPPSGTRLKKMSEYKARATTFTKKLDLGKFTYQKFTYVQGIHYANHVILGARDQVQKYCGKSLIVADNTMKLYAGLKITDDKEWKDKSSMGLIFNPTKVLGRPFEFYKAAGEKRVELEANLCSVNGVKYAGPGTPTWRRFYIYGNYMVKNLNYEAWKRGYIYIFYHNRISKKKDDGLVVSLSPILSSFQSNIVREKP